MENLSNNQWKWFRELKFRKSLLMFLGFWGVINIFQMITWNKNQGNVIKQNLATKVVNFQSRW